MALGEPIFHVRVYSKPAGLPDAVSITIAGRAWRVLPDVRSAMLGSLSASWEAASAALEQLGAFVEPDGSLVWVGSGPPSWQVEGQLFERSDRLQFVELKGRCPAAKFDQLLSAFGWPATALVFELVKEGVVVDEEEFRRLHAL